MMSSELATQGTCCSDNVTIKHLQGSLRFLLFIPSVTALSVPHTQHILSSCSVDAFVVNCQIEPVLRLLGGELSSSSLPPTPARLPWARLPVLLAAPSWLPRPLSALIGASPCPWLFLIPLLSVLLGDPVHSKALNSSLQLDIDQNSLSSPSSSLQSPRPSILPAGWQ